MSDGQICYKCGKPMTPESAKLRPELTLQQKLPVALKSTRGGTMKLTQCDLSSASWRTTAWIPSELAGVGEVLRFRSDDKLWTVTAVYATVNRDSVKDSQHNAKNIWRATSGDAPIGHK